MKREPFAIDIAAVAVLTGIAFLTFGATACTRATPQMAEATAAGMVPLANSRADEAWTRPGADISRYDKLLLAPTEFEFRDVPAYSGPAGRRSVTEFPVGEADREQLAEIVRETLRDELGNSQSFTLTDEPGPGVLVVRTALQDIVSRVPPEEPRREDIYIDRIGEATFVVNLDDSVSRETLVRLVDHRTAEVADGMGLRRPTLADRSSSVTNWAEVRREADRWARSLRAELDRLHGL